MTALPSLAHNIQTLSHSELVTFRRCMREWYYAYFLRRRSPLKDESQRIGTLWGKAQDAWWLAKDNKLDAALAVLSEPTFECAKLRAMMIGYHARWVQEPYRLIDVEKEFRVPLNKWFDLKGALDKTLHNLETDEIVFMEHKTTSRDIQVDSLYWRKISAMDPQVSIYFFAMKAMDKPAARCIYDVALKPQHKPLQATPEEQRKYTKPTKKDPVSRLYANQRAQDETIDEFEERVCNAIAENPDKYYARGNIVRLEKDELEHARDMHEYSQLLNERRLTKKIPPRNPDACERYYRLCEYFPVCSGQMDITEFPISESKDSYKQPSEV